MQAGADAPVRQALEQAVGSWASKAIVAETGAGDSLLIVHDDPIALAQAARHIMDEVYRTPHQPRLRVALHYGDVEVQGSVEDDRRTVLGGSALLCAARVEPHVQPGQIWVTDEFRQALSQRPSLWRTSEVRAPDGGERFNVRKDGRAEPDLWVRLYRLEF
jgi:class 3 adenylate cyclase